MFDTSNHQEGNSLTTGHAPEAVEHDNNWVFPQFDEACCAVEFLEALLSGEITFNGETHPFNSPVDWLENPSHDIEWHIQLHKFYFAPGLARQFADSEDKRWQQKFVSLVTSWTEQTPPGFIATDVTGRRVQNLSYAWVLFKEAGACFDLAFENLFITSIERQVEYIVAHLAPTRNHRTLELYSIFLSALVYPSLPNAQKWLQFAKIELVENLRGDILDDGVHCELSTGYHHFALRSYLLFYQLCLFNHISLPVDVGERLLRGLEFSMHIHRPDGNVPALSDSDTGSYLALLNWGAYLFGRKDFAFVASQGKTGSPPTFAHRVFHESGYAVLRSAWDSAQPYYLANQLVFDCGPIGAGNHGHLDGLNIEVYALGNPLIVDPGRYTYDEKGSYNWRAHFRQTRTHNTVTINETDQAMYVQRGERRKILPPHPVCRLVQKCLNGATPYLHGRIVSAQYAAIHNRHIWFQDQRYWIVVDHLQAVTTHCYEQRFHLGPAERGEIIEHGSLCTYQSLNLVLASLDTRNQLTIEKGYVAPTYGKKTKIDVVNIKVQDSNACIVTIILPVTPDAEIGFDADARASVVNIADRQDYWYWNAVENELTLQAAGEQPKVLFSATNLGNA